MIQLLHLADRSNASNFSLKQHKISNSYSLHVNTPGSHNSRLIKIYKEQHVTLYQNSNGLTQPSPKAKWVGPA